MSITPQAIKDQDFQVKFRGYDTIEVKAYLELLAEEFFELHELRRKQEDQYAELYEENQELKQEREALLEEERTREERSEASVLQFQEKDQIIADLRRQIESLERKVEGAEQEKSLQQEAWERQETTLRKEIDQLRAGLDDRQNAVSENSDEVERLRAQVETLERQVAEFKKEEVDFKVALVAAQRFADDVRKKAREEADGIMEQAIEEVEKFRQQSEEELAHLPVEIEALKKQKLQVREDLKAVLVSYLERLDGAPAGDAPVGDDDDLAQLFQSIPLGGDEEQALAMDVDTFEKK